ncbi:MAG: hypothetical protein SO366_08190 [Atopobiaceae bacterium]|nr:hypothetical protein [Atopobiaceae bacterium]
MQPEGKVLFIRKVQDEPPLRRSSGTMLGMAVAVILLVIANDVVIRGMERMESVPLPFLLSLRITHLAVCIFILYTEYQTLYKVRLEAGMEMARKLAEERSRQYAQSTATVQAINARMHDIRHKVRPVSNASRAPEASQIPPLRCPHGARTLGGTATNPRRQPGSPRSLTSRAGPSPALRYRATSSVVSPAFAARAW